ncbi:histidine kinase [Tamlana nanhaiensis]|uniref:Histidine kinase n=1 Tax=Neotamlana nanhaiensis TaxID=1382798 RepID=A0A0D7W669_9FLAO|nr:sensor histidine kinase [Tamlana nanhaiensis]KJD34524.1 histidine kinase [Tamlana nanhaiensis]
MSNLISARNKKIIIFFHVLVWIVLFSFPYLLSSGQQQGLTRVFVHSWLPLLLYAIVFYLNYFVLADKLLIAKKFVFFAVINIALIIVCVLIREYANTYFLIDLIPEGEDRKGPPIQFFIYLQSISFVVPIVFAIALKFAERLIKTESERKEAEKIKLEAELQHLKYQLQPHFFFNSLNNIYSLVDISPEQAKSSIHSLSKLMRYLLYDTTTEKVSLKQEVQFLEKYIELMQLRLTDKTTVTFKFAEVKDHILVAPLLFISLVENTFKHGVSANKTSALYFELKIENNTIEFQTKNPNFPKTDHDKSGSGIGIQNLDKRLNLIYPNKHVFTYGVDDDTFFTKLIFEVD